MHLIDPQQRIKKMSIVLYIHKKMNARKMRTFSKTGPRRDSGFAINADEFYLSRCLPTGTELRSATGTLF